VVTLADVKRGRIDNTANATAVDAKSLKVLGESTAKSFIASPGLLAYTGSNSQLLALFALLLAAVGLVVVRLARKRKH
jgi:LPXTG-motif cell wall-anchored protein